MKSVGEITLYDLMAEDLDVWLGGDNKFGYVLNIDDENGQELVNERGIHPFAIESLADFCRRYLACYNKITKSEVA